MYAYYVLPVPVDSDLLCCCHLVPVSASPPRLGQLPESFVCDLPEAPRSRPVDEVVATSGARPFIAK